MSYAPLPTPPTPRKKRESLGGWIRFLLTFAHWRGS